VGFSQAVIDKVSLSLILLFMQVQYFSTTAGTASPLLSAALFGYFYDLLHQTQHHLVNAASVTASSSSPLPSAQP
jgi:hypothetical protein